MGDRIVFKGKHTRRVGRREPVLLDARCRKSSWIVNQVELVNISEGGCCISGRIEGLVPGDDVTLRIADLGPLKGNVRWSDKRQAGIAFAKPITVGLVAELAERYRVGDAGRSGFLRSRNAA